MKRRRSDSSPNRLALASDETAPPAGLPRAAAPGELVYIVHTQWRWIAFTIIAATALASILAVALPRRYRATAIGVVAPLAGTLTPSEAFHGVEALDRRSLVATVAALPSTAYTASREYDISAAVLPNTNLVRIDVDARSPGKAASVANDTLTALGTQTRTMFKYYDVTLVKKAVPPTEAALPHRARIIAAGWVLGILLGFVLAYLRSRTIVRV